MLKVEIPEGKKGSVSIEKFEITERDATFSLFSYGARAPLPGIYTKLVINGYVIMSDTDAEMRDHYEPVRMAKDDILINGLGIGMVLLNCLEKHSVKTATVVEISQDVIDLVAPTYISKYGNRVNIINANALEWKPPKGAFYGMVWHDIWTDICSDNYEDMKRLHRRYGRKCDWQGSWSRYYVERQIKEDKANSWR